MDHVIQLADIEAAYRLILGRSPDRGGFDIYRDHAENGMTLRQLRQHFLQSEEFRQTTGFEIPVRVDSGGITFAVDANEPEFGRQIAEHGTWEPHLIEVLKRELGTGDVFVDVGANIGVMSFNAAAIVGPAGRVLAFEPMEDNILRFITGLAANKFANVKLFPFALSSERSTFAIQGSSNGYLMPKEAGSKQALALRGDDILIDEPRIDFVKIDIEGHEPYALDGLRETLKKHLPKILCEFNPRCLRDHIGRDPLEFAKQLFQLTDHIDAIDWDGTIVPVSDADTLIRVWHRQNESAVQTGRLPDGMAHLDLLLQVA